jgi:hypothetical protein
MWTALRQWFNKNPTKLEKEVEDMLKELEDQEDSPGIVLPHGTPYPPSPAPSPWVSGWSITYMTRPLPEMTYAPPSEQIISAWHKDYYLPALKVLSVLEDGIMRSPLQTGKWTDNELESRCPKTEALLFPEKTYPHTFDECSCGVYATARDTQILPLLYPDDFSIWFFAYAQAPRVVVIVEPSPDAEVDLHTEGWRATKAFISEILTGPDATMSPKDAHLLLSQVWDPKLVAWVEGGFDEHGDQSQDH